MRLLGQPDVRFGWEAADVEGEVRPAPTDGVPGRSRQRRAEAEGFGAPVHMCRPAHISSGWAVCGVPVQDGLAIASGAPGLSVGAAEL